MILAIALYGIITHNEHYFEIGLLLIGDMLAGGLLLAPVLGRFWCGWLCPRGTFLEYVLGKVSNRSGIPKKLRTTGFKLFIASIMAVMFLMVLLDICRDYTGKSKTIEDPDRFACMKCTDSCKSGANKPVISLHSMH